MSNTDSQTDSLDEILENWVAQDLEDCMRVVKGKDSPAKRDENIANNRKFAKAAINAEIAKARITGASIAAIAINQELGLALTVNGEYYLRKAGQLKEPPHD